MTNASMVGPVYEKLKHQYEDRKLAHNLAKYSLNPHATVSDVAQSLLAISRDRTSCNKFLMEEAQLKCNLTTEQIAIRDAELEIENERDIQGTLEKSNLMKYRSLLLVRFYRERNCREIICDVD